MSELPRLAAGGAAVALSLGLVTAGIVMRAASRGI